ncbi:TPA: DUF3560 domain-containing protein [Vibrio parahaemolyticus]
MNSYEQKQAARRERLEARAAKAHQESNAVYAESKAMADSIPFGQPILVGHHSEGRDRRYRARIHDKMGKSVELSKKADYYEKKAAAVGTGGISSDDPEAIEKLKKQLESINNAQEKMKAANRLIRKGDRDGLAALGFKPDQVENLFSPDYAGRLGFPRYALDNNRANGRRIEQRIKELEQARERDDVEIETEGYIYREDTTENRVMFIFDGKPDAETRKILKAHSFNWSPSREGKPWVRKLTNAGLYAAKLVRAALDAAE